MKRIHRQFEPLEFVEVLCGRCHGTGRIKRIKGRPFSKTLHEKKRAFQLYKRGFTLREIAAEMNIKNAQTAKNLIEAYVNYIELKSIK